MCCILFLLLIKNSLLSQTLEYARNFKLDKILSLPIATDKFIINVGWSYPSGHRSVYVIKRTEDSLLVTFYGGTPGNEIDGVYALSANNDTLFRKNVDLFYSNIKQDHDYQSYSKDVLTGGYFYLSFYEENKLQLFLDKKALPNQLAMMKSIVNRLTGFLITPISGSNPWKKKLTIKNWNELLKYLKTNSIDSLPK